MKVDKAAILKRAAEIVEERGWKDGGWISTDGPVCILAACDLACREVGAIEIGLYGAEEINYDELKDLSFYTSLLRVGCGGNPWLWNDELPCGTFDEMQASKRLVISKLLEAADMEAQAVIMPKNGCGG